MRNLAIYIFLVFFGITFAGCSVALREINKKSHSYRTDIFNEVKESDSPEKGFVDLIIKTSLKTHTEDYYILESKKSLHGKPEYPFLINIGGQAAMCKIKGQKEIIPLYDEKGKKTKDGGEGVRYNLEKKIRLAAGSYNIFFGLPEEECFKELEVILKEGNQYIMEVKPIYKKNNRRVQSFLYGVKEIDVSLDSTIIR
ncbi:MAG: hypothetical protein AB1498_01340 [bacterium]